MKTLKESILSKNPVNTLPGAESAKVYELVKEIYRKKDLNIAQFLDRWGKSNGVNNPSKFKKAINAGYTIAVYFEDRTDGDTLRFIRKDGDGEKGILIHPRPSGVETMFWIYPDGWFEYQANFVYLKFEPAAMDALMTIPQIARSIR